LRVLAVHTLARPIDYIRRHMPRLVVVPFPVVPPQAGFVALVFGTDRQETAVGIAEVDHHRLVVTGAHLPNRIEARIIRLDVGPVRILESKTYVFPDLQSLGPGFEAELQLGGGTLGPT